MAEQQETWEDLEQRTIVIDTGNIQGIKQENVLTALIEAGVDISTIDAIGQVDRGFKWAVTFESLEDAKKLVERDNVRIRCQGCLVSFMAD